MVITDLDFELLRVNTAFAVGSDNERVKSDVETERDVVMGFR